MKGALKLMAWTKAKTVIVGGAAILLAAGTTTVVAKKIAAAPGIPKVPALSATDLSWADDPKYWATDSRVLGQLPAGVFIFRPTKFPTGGGGVWVGDRMCVKNESVRDLVDNAYSFPYTRTVFPADIPRDHFDVLVTVEGRKKELLKDELKKRFNLTSHNEKQDREVLFLKVKNPNPPNLKPHAAGDGNSSWIGGDHEVRITNYQLKDFFGNVESTMGQPVIDQTGLNDSYDLTMRWKPKPGESNEDAFKRALSEQLGLELVPGRATIDVLVVEKAN